MKLTKIYIGADNSTKKLDLELIKSIASSMLTGCTIYTGTGIWQGKLEDCAIIEIYGTFNTDIIPELKSNLSQDSVMVATSNMDVDFYE